MAILQALFALISRSAGKLLNAVFGWAVRALFGRTSPKERTVLSGLVGAAAAWPILLVGVVAPKTATRVLAFLPLSDKVPSAVVRLIWVALALVVPLAIGLTMAAKAPAHAPRRSFARRLLSGFPITVGLATAFLIMFISVPVMHLWSLLRGQQSADIPLITEASGYHEIAALTTEVLNDNGFGLKRAEPGWWVAAPTRVLKFFGGAAFGAFVPDDLEHYQAADIMVSFYPSGILVRGKGQRLTWAHGLILEATAHGVGFQTTVPAAQDLEKQIKRLWRIYEEEPQAHRHSPRLLNRVNEVARDLASADIVFDDWQVVYRQLLQLERALHGYGQLLEQQAQAQAHDRTLRVGQAPQTSHTARPAQSAPESQNNGTDGITALNRRRLSQKGPASGTNSPSVGGSRGTS